MYSIYFIGKLICSEYKVYDQQQVHRKDTVTWVHIKIGEDFGYGPYAQEPTIL